MTRSRPRQGRDRNRYGLAHGGAAGVVRAAFGILLLLASTGIASVHAHELAHDAEGTSLVASGPTDGPLSTDQLAPADCQLCDLTRRSEAEFAALPAAPIVVVEATPPRSSVRLERTMPRARVFSRQAPRAPPVFSV